MRSKIVAQNREEEEIFEENLDRSVSQRSAALRRVADGETYNSGQLYQ